MQNSAVLYALPGRVHALIACTSCLKDFVPGLELWEDWGVPEPQPPLWQAAGLLALALVAEVALTPGLSVHEPRDCEPYPWETAGPLAWPFWALMDTKAASATLTPCCPTTCSAGVMLICASQQEVQNPDAAPCVSQEPQERSSAAHGAAHGRCAVQRRESGTKVNGTQVNSGGPCALSEHEYRRSSAQQAGNSA